MSLFDGLSNNITVLGASYPIHTDFRVWIKFESIVGNLRSDPVQTVTEILKLCLIPGKLPPSLTDTLKELLNFYIGKNEFSEKEPGDGVRTQRIYDFEYDSEYIYSAFMQLYGIDLCSADMHWQQFKALFSSITGDTKFGEIMRIRAVSLDEISGKKQKAHYRRLKQIFALPDLRSEQEKERDLADAICSIM